MIKKPVAQEKPYTDQLKTANMKVIKYRLLSILLAIAAVILAVMNIIIAQYPKTIPYVVELTPDGEARYVPDAVAVMDDWQPKDATVRYTLSNFIVNLRSVSSDAQVTRQNLLKVYGMLTSTAEKTVKAWITESQPLVRGKKETVRINVFSLSKLSEETWQIDWRETTWTLTGSLTADERYRVIVHTQFYTPRTEKQMEENPIGLWITNLEINKVKDI